MEHKLILGGEKYLPFARSRIKALLAGGLPYASQKFVIDGTSIDVRVTPGHEYITITGGEASLYMDSGVVDGLAETLVWTATAKEYFSGFTEPTPNGFLTNPANTSHGQLGGHVSIGDQLKGRLPPDGAEAASFSRGYTEPVENAGYVKKPADEQQAAKLNTAFYCPASVFTGRCRKYVQAMYGQMLYRANRSEGEVTSSSLVGAPPVFEPGNPGSSPQLRVPSADSAGDVTINTSSGVIHVDQLDTYFLVVLRGDGVLLGYRLKESPGGAALAAFVRENPAGLTSEDLLVVEQYRLSGARPVVGWTSTAGDDVGYMGGFEIGALRPPEVVSNYSYGYGWHWDYTESKARIVQTETESSNPDGSSMLLRSWLATLELTALVTQVSGGVVLSITRNVTAGASKVWGLNRLYFCIAEPDWGDMAIRKSYPKNGGMVEVVDAPVYFCEAGLVTVTCTRVKAVGATDTSSHPRYLAYGAGNYLSRETIGLRGGWAETRDDGAKNVDGGMNALGQLTPENAYYWTVQFKCGSVAAAPVHMHHIEVGSRIETSEKVLTSSAPPYLSSFWEQYVLGLGYTMDVGYPDDAGVYAKESERAAVLYRYQNWVDYSIETHTFADTWKGEATIVVPLYDSEAVYFHSSSRVEHSKAGRNIRRLQIATRGGYVTSFRFRRDNATVGGQNVNGVVQPTYVDTEWESDYKYSYTWYTPAGPSETQLSYGPADPYTSVSVLGDYFLLVTKGGTQSYTLNQLGQYHDDSIETVSGYFKVMSGALNDGAHFVWGADLSSGVSASEYQTRWTNYAGSQMPLFVGYS